MRRTLLWAGTHDWTCLVEALPLRSHAHAAIKEHDHDCPPWHCPWNFYVLVSSRSSFRKERPLRRYRTSSSWPRGVSRGLFYLLWEIRPWTVLPILRSYSSRKILFSTFSQFFFFFFYLLLLLFVFGTGKQNAQILCTQRQVPSPLVPLWGWEGIPGQPWAAGFWSIDKSKAEEIFGWNRKWLWCIFSQLAKCLVVLLKRASFL